MLSGFDVYVARSETTGMRLTSMNSPGIFVLNVS